MSDEFKNFLLRFTLPYFVILLVVTHWLFNSWIPGIGGIVFGMISCIVIYCADPNARK